MSLQYLYFSIFKFLAGILTQIERIKGVVSSVILFVFWLLIVLAGIVPCFTKILEKVVIIILVSFEFDYPSEKNKHLSS